MNKYLLVFKLSLYQAFEYRFDFFMGTFKYASYIILMSLIWLGVNQFGNIEQTTNQTVTYFIFAALLYSFSNFHPYYIEEDIRLGFLNQYLLKPISPTYYYLAKQSAWTILETLMKIFVIIPIIYLFGFRFTTDLPHLLLFLLYPPLIFFFAFNLLTGISNLVFWLSEAFALRWATTIVQRFLSGMLVPISYFSPFFQKISFYLPFEHLGYVPIQVLTNQFELPQIYASLTILASWSMVMFAIRQTVWRIGLYQYEGTGI